MLSLSELKRRVLEQVANETQREIIEYSEKRNVGILAGPGSGKTFVIIERIKHYLSKRRVAPERIMIVTYTNRAIIEIKKRINLFEHKYEFKYSGTLHSICKKFLEGSRLRGELQRLIARLTDSEIELKATLPIFGENEHQQFCRAEVEDYVAEKFPDWALDKRREKVIGLLLKELREGISRNKVNNYLRDSKFELHKTDYVPRIEFDREVRKLKFVKRRELIAILKKVFEKYQAKLKADLKFDHDDLLIYFHYLVWNLTPLRKKELIQSEFDEILVDEFQDMNLLQLLIVREFSGDKKNIFFVGDPNQSIYAFQGAYPEIFNYFREQDPETKFFKLTQNYRSTKSILELSEQLIKKNKKKGVLEELSTHKMFTNSEEGERIFWLVTDRWGGPCSSIYNIVLRLEELGAKRNQIAILSRTYSDAKDIRSFFRNKGINYIDFNFWKNNTDWLAESYYLACFLSLRFMQSDFAIHYLFEKYLEWRDQEEVMPDYFMKEIESYSASLVDHLDWLCSEGLSLKYSSDSDLKNIEKIRGFWREVKAELSHPDSEEAGKKFIVDSRELKKYIKGLGANKILEVVKDRHKESISDICNFFAVMTRESSGMRLDESIKLLHAYVRHFVEHTLEEDYLTFSTIHSAKGCEWDYVFVLNLREGKLPIFHAQTKEEIEEERRVLFVGMTRAKKELYLVSDLGFFNSSKSNKNALTSYSSFLKELKFGRSNPKIVLLSDLHKHEIEEYEPQT
ncbi:DNA helicase, UvrD type [Candidatus Mycoplasma haematolamae str. Purdue]|uniref:DNA 3'-5' helicase n=1 Tax=Mycoplasma haematolamae (strain Purdue) TaxID=1212765 RepID=I7BIX1_MYCHA|nr:ATP-dependent helicase [Candidatus Mycoplasma haematolamae]AFO51773.1 DNA helicase, UvrD type [Candidatus Mycoplasma haematolamae str. Purdue]